MNQITHFLIHVLMQYVPFVFYMVVLVQLIGLPAPAIPFLIGAGILVGAGHMILGTVVGLGVLVVLFGDQIWYRLGRRPNRRDIRSEAGTIVSPSARAVDLRMPQFLLHTGAGTLLLVGSGVGLGFAFSDRLDKAVSVVAYPGLMTALVLIGIVASYIIYNVLHRAGEGRLGSKLTVQHITKQTSGGEALAVIDLRPQGTCQDISSTPGSLAFSAVLRPDTRSRQR